MEVWSISLLGFDPACRSEYYSLVHGVNFHFVELVILIRRSIKKVLSVNVQPDLHHVSKQNLVHEWNSLTEGLQGESRAPQATEL